MHRNRVDLPAPDGPRSTVTLPASIERLVGPSQHFALVGLADIDKFNHWKSSIRLKVSMETYERSFEFGAGSANGL